MQFVDINNKEDLDLAKDICAEQRIEKVQHLKMLSKSINSCVLRDISKENGMDHFFSN